MSRSSSLQSLQYVIRKLAQSRQVQVQSDTPVRVEPEADEYFIDIRVASPPAMATLTIDGRLLDVEPRNMLDIVSAEFDRACAQARGAAVTQLLEQQVSIDEQSREKLCDRLTGLIMALAKKDPALCETLALKLMAEVEKVPR